MTISQFPLELMLHILSKHVNVRNMIIEKKYENLKIIVIERKTFQNEKRMIVNEKYILTMSKIHDLLAKWEKIMKKSKITEIKKGKKEINEIEQDYIDESEAS